MEAVVFNWYKMVEFQTVGHTKHRFKPYFGQGICPIQFNICQPSAAKNWYLGLDTKTRLLLTKYSE